MTSLQQTAMGGGSATAKVASYVLVAADAGTTVAMNAAGATTITVNTALFAAGDTVFIQNLGAGACTVTAGTATVATAGSLILPQNDAGILYFTATGASIFYDYIQAGAVSPLTTKGDLYTFSTSDARLGVGANNTTLVADSAEATGLKWATPSSGGMTLLSTTTLSGASTTISSIDQTYKNLTIVGKNIYVSSTGTFQLEVNGDTGSDYALTNLNGNGTTAATSANENSAGYFVLGYVGTDNTYSKTGNFDMTIPRYSETEYHPFNSDFVGYATSLSIWLYYTGRFRYNDTAAITSLKFISGNGTFSGGTIYIYGVK